MTTLDVLTTPDALTLFAAIDAGDDLTDPALLPALADLLEEAGVGVPGRLRAGYRPHDTPARPYRFWWASPTNSDVIGPPVPWSLPQATYGRIGKTSTGYAHYTSRSRAYLALAEALADAY
jgi:hypothetical protein